MKKTPTGRPTSPSLLNPCPINKNIEREKSGKAAEEEEEERSEEGKEKGGGSGSGIPKPTYHRSGSFIHT